MNKLFWLFVIFIMFSSLRADDFKRPPDPRLDSKIQTLKLLKLTEELNLTEEQTAVIFPLVKKNREKLFELFKQKEKLIDSLDGLIRENKIDRKHCDKIIDAIDEIGYQIREEMENFRNEMRDILTYKQYVKYIVFEEKFPRRLKKYLHEIRRGMCK